MFVVCCCVGVLFVVDFIVNSVDYLFGSLCLVVWQCIVVLMLFVGVVFV